MLVSETSRRHGLGARTHHTIAPIVGQSVSVQRAISSISTAPSLHRNAFDLDKKAEARCLVLFTDIKEFHIHVIFATDNAIAGASPRSCATSLQGWFETIAFMRSHKAETVKAPRTDGEG